MIVTVSGRTYLVAIADSSVPREEHWPMCEGRRVGKGMQYRYDVDVRMARLIASHLHGLASPSEEQLIEARTIIAWCEIHGLTAKLDDALKLARWRAGY